MPEPVPDRRLIDALESRAFRAMLPELVSFAIHRLYRASVRAGRPRLAQPSDAEDVVQNAVRSCAEGARRWPPDVPFASFMFGVVESFAGHTYAASLRHAGPSLDDVPELASPEPPCDEQLDRRRLLARAEEATRSDPETHALFETIADGNCDDKRADHAGAREWTVERVSNVRVKMNRRLAAAGILQGENDNDDCDDEQASGR